MESWKHSASDQYVPTLIDGASAVGMKAGYFSEQHAELTLKYHELKVTIFHKYVKLHLAEARASADPRSRGTPCVESAREVLAQAHLWEPNSTSFSWSVLTVIFRNYED